MDMESTSVFVYGILNSKNMLKWNQQYSLSDCGSKRDSKWDVFDPKKDD